MSSLSAGADGDAVERIEKCSVVATQLDVVEHEPATHRVVRDVEDVVRLGVRAPPLQNSQARIESLDESDFVCELVHGADAAACNRVTAPCDLVVDRVSAELGSIRARFLSTLGSGKARLDLPCCGCELSPYVLFHLKAS